MFFEQNGLLEKLHNRCVPTALINLVHGSYTIDKQIINSELCSPVSTLGTLEWLIQIFEQTGLILVNERENGFSVWSTTTDPMGHVPLPTSNPAPVHPDPELNLSLGRIITPPLPLVFDGLLFFSDSAGLCCCPIEAGSVPLFRGPVGVAEFCGMGGWGTEVVVACCMVLTPWYNNKAVSRGLNHASMHSVRQSRLKVNIICLPRTKTKLLSTDNRKACNQMGLILIDNAKTKILIVRK